MYGKLWETGDLKQGQIVFRLRTKEFITIQVAKVKYSNLLHRFPQTFVCIGENIVYLIQGFLSVENGCKRRPCCRLILSFAHQHEFFSIQLIFRCWEENAKSLLKTLKRYVSVLFVETPSRKRFCNRLLCSFTYFVDTRS